MKKILVAVWLLALPCAAAAQDGEISGTVADDTGRRPAGSDRRGVIGRAAHGSARDGDRHRRPLRPHGVGRRQLCRHVQPARLRAGAARRGADGRSPRDARCRPARRRPLRGGDRLRDRHRHRGARHQHAPRGHRGQPGGPAAAGGDAARRPLPEPERQPRRRRRAEQLVQLEPAGHTDRERGERQSARPGRLADARADQRPAPRAGAGAPHRRALRRREHDSGHRHRPARGAEGGRGGHLRLRCGRGRRQLRHPQTISAASSSTSRTTGSAARGIRPSPASGAAGSDRRGPCSRQSG